MSSMTLFIGWGLSSLVSAIFFMGAYAQLNYDLVAKSNSSVPELPDWTHVLTAISLCIAAVVHMVPQAAFATLGAIIMTGMIGGMIGVLLLQDNALWWTRILLGLLPWLGLYLRSPEFNDLMSFWR